MQYDSLSNLHIAQCIDALSEYLEGTTLGRADCIRITFSVEEALLHYQEAFGEDTPFTFTSGKKWGKEQFAVTLRGASLNPFTVEDDPEYPSISKAVMGQMGLFPEWKYTGQQGNVIYMFLPKTASSPLKKLGLAVLLAVAIYLVSLLLPAAFGAGLYEYGVMPLVGVFTGLLSTVSGPIIFCSIVSSICNMGDVATFGKIGKRTMVGFVCSTALVAVVGCFWLVFIYPPTGLATAHGANAFFEIYKMLLDVAPTNLVISFIDGNPMQIVTLAIIGGFGLLALQQKTDLIAKFFAQCNSLLLFVMEGIAAFIHIYVFLSVLGLLLSGQMATVLEIYRLVLYLVIGLILAGAYSILRSALATKASPILLIKKLIPTFVIAFTTASSTAAFAVNIKTCQEELGITAKLTHFAIPLGQVVYMPASAVFLGVLSFYMYDIYDLPITGSVLITMFLLCVILSIATTPVPGGFLAIVNILFLQLGIPAEGLALAIIFSTITDFLVTAVNVCLLQLELVSTAKKLKQIDLEVF